MSMNAPVMLSREEDQPCAYQEKLQALEKHPLTFYQQGDTTYQSLARGASLNPQKVAIRYMLRGDYYDPTHIPLKAKIIHKLVGPVACPYREITYQDLFTQINQCANFLHDLGIQKDDVVSLILPNFIETHVALWGAEAAGIANPINPLLEANVIRDILNEVGAKVLITMGDVPGSDIWTKVQAIKDQVPSLNKVLVLFGKANKDKSVMNFEKNLARYPGTDLLSRRQIAATDIASLFHTGGTTGTPKIAQHTHANEVANATMIKLCLQQENTRFCDENVLVALPLFHVNAAIATGLTVLSQGMTMTLAGPAGFRSDKVIERFFDIVEHYKVSFFSAVPTAIGALNNQDCQHNDLSSLKFAISGAAPIPVETFKAFQQKTQVQLLEGYGLTEASCVSSLTPLENLGRPGSVGMRLPHSEMRILVLDDNLNCLREAKVNEIGAVAVAGAHVFPGYLKEEDNQGLWIDLDGRRFFNTGDLGRCDQDGYFWLTGRKKELIIRGGHNIDPKSIEEPMASIVGVELVAAVARPDKYAGEVPVLYLTTQDKNLDESFLMEQAKSLISERAAIPKRIEIISEMPITAVGKIFKPQLCWWQIEEVVKQHIHEVMPEIQLDDYQVEVVKHEVYGCITNIHFVNAQVPESLSVLQAHLDAYAFKYAL